MGKKICFFTVATGRWKIFILPYIFSCLYYNKDAFVEILTRDNDVNQEALKTLRQIFGDSFSVRELPWIDPDRFMPDAALRFILEPQTKLEYTYIGDVDIFILDSYISTFQGNIIESSGGYYSNVVRLNHDRKLTGLHCVKTKPYYDKTRAVRESIVCSTGSDEIMLYDIVEKCIGDPKNYPNKIIREHGFHLSLMREPKKDPSNPTKPSWSISSLKYQKEYLRLKNTKEWQSIYPFFDEKYKSILRQVEDNF